MSDTDKSPREFWIVREVITNSYFVSETKVPWKEIEVGDERIHVIEYSAFEKLQQQLDEARAEIKICKDGWSIVSSNYLKIEDQLKEKDEEIEILRHGLEKIEDPRKRDHKEPDLYTELGCIMNIATETLELANTIKDKDK